MDTILTFIWSLLSLVLWALYGFHIEGMENLPRTGPFIFLLKEGGGPMSMILVAVAHVMALHKLRSTVGNHYLVVMHEDVWAKIFSKYPVPFPVRPLRPHSAGVLALGLMDQLEILREGGVAIINPEGDLSWDGRPLLIRSGAAWLSLHTAALLVPLTCTTGGYDIWPLWQKRPKLSGRAIVRIGRPFKLCDSPMERVTQQDLEKACARIKLELEQLYYGPGGVSEWASPPMQHGAPTRQPIQFQPLSAQLPSKGHQAGPGPVVVAQSVSPIRDGERNWGIPQLLWRCPLCHTNDTLIHQYPRFRPQSLYCQACGTRWTIRRVHGKDFRLNVVEGPADLIGLDMALSTWCDQMKAGFQPAPIQARDVELQEGAELYLRADQVELLPYKPSLLFDGWTSGEAPRAQPGGQAPSPDWASIGTGRLFLTNRGLHWDGPQGSLDFWWPSVRSVFMPWQSTLGISYGSAFYRFTLGHEVGLKWLTYAGTLTQQAAAREGHKVAVTPF